MKTFIYALGLIAANAVQIEVTSEQVGYAYNYARNAQKEADY